MRTDEIARVQAYLRKTFGNNSFQVKPPAKAGQPVEVYLGEEFVGVLYRDDDEGEVSYSLTLTILEDDLPPMGSV